MYQCRRCAALHEDEVVDQWGTNGIGDGHGPEPVCTELVDDKRQRPDSRGDYPQMNCHGPLTYTEA